MDLPEYIFHLAEQKNWSSIQKNGLASTRVLLSDCTMSGKQRTQFVRKQRKRHTVLPNGVEVRDQKPMPATALHKCLVAITPSDWYQLLNSHVFFWLDEERLNRQKKACEPRPQLVLIINTSKIVNAYKNKIFFTPINTGYALRKAAVRGPATFVSYHDWLESGWKTEADELQTCLRPSSHKPVEVAVRGSIPDIRRYIQHVQPLRIGEQFKGVQ